MNSHRSSPRVLTPRRKRLWTVESVSASIAAATVGNASQVSQNLGTAFESQSGMNLREATVGRVFINGVYSMVPASSPTQVTIGMGLIVGQDTLDNLEFPSIVTGSGDYFVRDVRTAMEPDDNVAGARPLEPHGVSNGGGSVLIDGKSKRTVKRLGETVWWVAQKVDAIEQPLDIDVAVTILWLY